MVGLLEPAILSMISENPASPPSRPRGRPRTRVEVGDVLRLHLPELIAGGFAIPGELASSRLVGHLDDSREVRFRLDVDMRQEAGRALIAPDGGTSYTVEIASTSEGVGGRRWWLICPVTGRRAATLYWPPSAVGFASRQAHGLTYRSQRLGERGRAAEAAAAIYAEQGGERDPAKPFPKRPKGMRRATYERQRARAGGRQA